MPQDDDPLARAIAGALRAAIHAHGPIMLEHIGSPPTRLRSWFSLSYANCLVLHRSLLQEMPAEWQQSLRRAARRVLGRVRLGEGAAFLHREPPRRAGPGPGRSALP